MPSFLLFTLVVVHGFRMGPNDNSINNDVNSVNNDVNSVNNDVDIDNCDEAEKASFFQCVCRLFSCAGKPSTKETANVKEPIAANAKEAIPDGITTNSITTHIATNGITTHITTHGITTDIITNGISTNGIATNGMTTNGI